MARSSSFFSLQPSQRGGLSEFARFGADLEHAGSMQEFIDPSLGGGEGLELQPSDEPLDPSTLGQTDEGGYYSTTTGTKFSLPGGEDGQQPTGARRRSPVTGAQDVMSPEQQQARAALGLVQTGLGGASKVASILEDMPATSETTGTRTSTSDWLRSEGAQGDLASIIASNPDQLNDFIRSLSLPGGTSLAGTAYEDILGGAEGEERFTLGADLKLTDPTDPTKQISVSDYLRDFGSVAGLGQAAVSGDPAQILPALNRIAPGVAKYLTDNQDIIGGVGNVSMALGGAYSLATGIQSQNPAQIAGGLGQLLNGAGHIVGMQAIADLAGVSVDTLSQGLGAFGGITGAISLANAIQNGDPVQALMGAVSLYSGLSSVAPTIFTPLTQLAAQALAQAAPQVAAQLGISATGTLTAGAASAVAGVAAVAAVVIMAVVSYIGNAEEMAARSSGWWNNPIRGALYSSATAGVGSANKILDQIDQVGVDSISTDQLMGALPSIVSSLQPYYATAQGGRGAIRASETAGSPGTQTKEEYTANFSNARDRLAEVVNSLLARGVTYEQLGAIDIPGDWTLESLDAGGTPDEYINRSPRAGEFLREGAGLYGKFNLAGYDPYRGAFGDDLSWQSQFGPGGINTPEAKRNFLLEQSLGASMKAPDEITKAGGLYTSMYGGELWAALARMGVPDQNIQNLLLSRFDPWVQARTWPSTQWVSQALPNPYALDEYGNPINPAAWGVMGGGV